MYLSTHRTTDSDSKDYCSLPTALTAPRWNVTPRIRTSVYSETVSARVPGELQPL